MKNDNGIVTLSFDCEGRWGMADRNHTWLSELTIDNLTEAYEYILETLNKYNIGATFAFVGAMTETKEDFINRSLPVLTGINHQKWLEPILKSIDRDEGWFVPKVFELVKNNNAHECASHGYTHTPFSYLDSKEFITEMNLIKQWSVDKKIKCKTLIYPRNDINYSDHIKGYGIDLYRSSPKLFNVKKFPKFINSFFEELNIFKDSEELDSYGSAIPGGVFINWRYGSRKLIPNAISNMKYRNILNSAIKNNNIAHFWTHPHNFITAPESKKIFEKLCQQIAKKVETNELEVRRQIDFI